MPEIGENTHLKDLIGCDSFALLELLPFANFFLRELSKAWVGKKITKFFKHVWIKRNARAKLQRKAPGMAAGVHKLSSLPKNFGTKRDFNPRL